MTTFRPAAPGKGIGPAAPPSRPHLLSAAIAAVLLAAVAAPVAALGGAGFGTAQHGERLAAAFRLAEAVPTDRPLLQRLKATAAKADRLATRADCGAQTWPDIHPRCLVAAEGGVRRARSVTVEYRAGERTSLLVRLPAGSL